MTQRKPTDDFAQLIDAFLGYIKNVRNLSPNTVESYKIDLELFLEWTRAHNIDPLKLEHIQVRSYLAYMRQAHYADKTVARRLSSLRSLYQWLVVEGYTTEDAPAATLTPKLSRKLPEVMHNTDVEKVLESCNQRVQEAQTAFAKERSQKHQEAYDQAILDKALIEFMYATGARISEIAALHLDDIDFASSNVRLFGKGRKERIVPLYPAAIDAMKEYIKEARPHRLPATVKENDDPRNRMLNLNDTSVFISPKHRPMTASSLRNRFEKIICQAGLSGAITPHTMRHTFATELLQGGADLRSVQELLGHASLSTTQIYTHLSVNRLKEAARLAHPRSGA